MSNWKWWRIYWMAVPLAAIAALLLDLQNHPVAVAFIGGTMSFILGRATQQSETNDENAIKEGN